nr:putative reverse transcriptase domain, reverse transcriptase zinc-binding domain protein [Tanacetum cinerariifolium]
MHNYHLDRGQPRCAFKVDIQKAYDTVDWDFLRYILSGFGFHPRMIGWIMECVATTSYSISINGTLHGFFKGKRGLRQGDPLSPYLFTLVMEILTLMLKRRVSMSNNFTYHNYCSHLNIINLCFADDLFLFAHGDTDSARVIMDSLNEFKNASGLVPSLLKSMAYFCNVVNHIKLEGRYNVTNTWAKFGFKRIMSDDDGLLYFQFSSQQGLEKVLEQVIAYSEIGLSLIATQVGKPIMLDAFTNTMCTEAWGTGYARALVEINADKELKKEVVMVVPNVDDETAPHTMVTIQEHCGEKH